MGVPLPPRVAHGGRVVDAVQQPAVGTGQTGRAAGHRDAVREAMIGWAAAAIWVPWRLSADYG